MNYRLDDVIFEWTEIMALNEKYMHLSIDRNFHWGLFWGGAY